MSTAPDASAAGFTVRDLSQRWRVSEDKVRAWIGKGEQKGVNTATNLCGRPRWVVSPDAVAEFEKRRAGSSPPKLKRARKRTQEEIDYFP
jgi:transposase